MLPPALLAVFPTTSAAHPAVASFPPASRAANRADTAPCTPHYLPHYIPLFHQLPPCLHACHDAAPLQLRSLYKGQLIVGCVCLAALLFMASWFAYQSRQAKMQQRTW